MNIAFLCACVLYLVAACSAGNPGVVTQIEFFKLLMKEKFLDPSTTVESLYHISETCLVSGLKHVTVSITYISDKTDDAYFANLVETRSTHSLIDLHERNVVRVNMVEMNTVRCGFEWDLSFRCFVDFVQDFAGVDIDKSYSPGPSTQQAFFDIIKEARLIDSSTTIYDVYKILKSDTKAGEIWISIDLVRAEKDDKSYAELIAKPDMKEQILGEFAVNKVEKVLNVKVMLTNNLRQDSFLGFHCFVIFAGGLKNKSSERESAEKSKSSGPRDEPKYNKNTTPPQQNAENPYDILGVGRTAPFQEVQQAYRRLLMIYHPDKTYGNLEKAEKAKKIIGAFEAIEKEEKKKWPEPKLS